MEWVGFQFNYAIETNLDAARSILTKLGSNTADDQALARRADALFPPMLETIFLDARMCIVEDAALLDILQRPYHSKSGRRRDYNLAKERLPILDEFVDAFEWQDFCRRARRTSEDLQRKRPEFIDLCEQRAKFAEQKLGNRVDQLRLRRHRLSFLEQMADSVLAQEISTESALSQAFLDGIRHPHIRLDSVGFIIISGRPPVQSEEEGDDS
jgi:ATP-dependent helicase HepA